MAKPKKARYPKELDGVALILLSLPDRIRAEMDRRHLSYVAVRDEMRGQISASQLHNIVTKKQEPGMSNIILIISWLQISSHGEA